MDYNERVTGVTIDDRWTCGCVTGPWQ